MTSLRTLREDDLWLGEMRGLELAGRRILVLRLEAGVRAYENRCPHLGATLSDGTLRGCVLTCAAHLYQYDAATGFGINPRSLRLVELPTAVADGWIHVELDAASNRHADAAGQGGARDD